MTLPEFFAYSWHKIKFHSIFIAGIGGVVLLAIVLGWSSPAAAPNDGIRLGTFTGSANTVRPSQQPSQTPNPKQYASSLVANVPTVLVAPIADQRALGIAAGSSLPTLDDSQLAQYLNGVVALGARWIRFDFDWSQVQAKNAQEYNWSIYDRIVAAATARHLEILGVLDYTPGWARQPACGGTSKCAPAQSSQFAAYASTTAKRYAPQGVHYWEIWNEPNSHDFWQPNADPAQYVGLLRDSYNALHAADSRAHVITAGLSPQATGSGSFAPYDFLAGVYADGGKPYFDAVGDHPYTFPLSPTDNADDAWTQMARAASSFRSLMVSYGDATKKIWITEYGAPTGGPGPVSTVSNPNLDAHPYVVDPDKQAKLLSDAIGLYRTYDWAGPLFYYSYQDAGTDQSTNENFFGLITHDGTQKPAYAIFKQNAATF